MRIASSPYHVIPGINASLEDAFEAAFGHATLQHVHGPSLKLMPWKHAQRKVRFSMPVPHNIPKELARFVCGKHLRFTVSQTASRDDDDSIHIVNKVRMHFIGAELFRVQPSFVLKRNPDNQKYVVQGNVRVDAILPTPLNRIAEAFMLEHSTSEFDRWIAAIDDVARK